MRRNRVFLGRLPVAKRRRLTIPRVLSARLCVKLTKQTEHFFFAVSTGVSGVVCRSALTFFRHVPILSWQRRALRRTVSWCSCAAGTEICSTGQPRISTSWARCARRQRPISRDYVENVRGEDVNAVASEASQIAVRSPPSTSPRTCVRAFHLVRRAAVVGVCDKRLCVSSVRVGCGCEGDCRSI